MLRAKRALPALIAGLSLTGAACGLAPVARADGGPAMLASNVPDTVQADVPTNLSATFSDGAAPITSIAWSFGDGTTLASGAQTSHAWGGPGTFTVTVSAVDALGNQLLQTFLVNVTPASPPLTTTTPIPAPAPLTFTASQLRARWKLARGTVFTLALNQTADVSISLARTGRIEHALGPRLLETLSTRAAAGVDQVAFDGRLGGGRRLGPGNTRATFMATAGTVTAAPVTLDFTIKRTRKR